MEKKITMKKNLVMYSLGGQYVNNKILNNICYALFILSNQIFTILQEVVKH
jgi:GTP-dependent phosphoenolpyruvate carboxykinase